jgi:hypothetical protein
MTTIATTAIAIVLCNGVLKNGNPCRYKAKQGMFCKIHCKVSSTCVQKETCSICYDKDVDCSLSCKHSFCKCCITKWLKENDMCRYINVTHRYIKM